MEHNALTHEHLQRNQNMTLGGPLFNFSNSITRCMCRKDKMNEIYIATVFFKHVFVFRKQGTIWCSKFTFSLWKKRTATFLFVWKDNHIIISRLDRFCSHNSWNTFWKFSFAWHSLFQTHFSFRKVSFFWIFSCLFQLTFPKEFFLWITNLNFISLTISSSVWSRGCLSISKGSSWKSPVFKESYFVLQKSPVPNSKKVRPSFQSSIFLQRKKGATV